MVLRLSGKRDDRAIPRVLAAIVLHEMCRDVSGHHRRIEGGPRVDAMTSRRSGRTYGPTFRTATRTTCRLGLAKLKSMVTIHRCDCQWKGNRQVRPRRSCGSSCGCASRTTASSEHRKRKGFRLRYRPVHPVSDRKRKRVCPANSPEPRVPEVWNKFA